MGHWAYALAFCLLPGAALPDVLTYEIWPTADPSESLSCLIALTDGQIRVVEVRGAGMPPRHPLRWPVRPAEEAAVLAALQALISGEVPGVDIYGARNPTPPYLTITWSSQVNGTWVSGLYIQPGLALPQVLAQVLTAVIPSSRCRSQTESSG